MQEANSCNKVLLIDDDEMLLKTAELLLSDTYFVRSASSVSKAKGILQNSRYYYLIVLSTSDLKNRTFVIACFF
jgi:DNA-binding NtrC family response regulator